MKKLGFLVLMAGVIILSAGCSEGLEEDGINYVQVTNIEELNNGCEYRYHISFHDDANYDHAQPYWAGLVRMPGEELVAYDTAIWMDPPFADGQLQVSINLGSAISANDDVYAKVFRSDTPGDPNYNYGSGISSGSVWFPGFSESCYPFTINIEANGIGIEEQQCVYIDETPAMPDLVAMISSGNVSGLVDWNLRVSYTRSGRTDEDVYSATIDANSAWYITDQLQSTVRGGQATLTCDPYGVEAVRTFSFAIRGTNASESDIVNYIESRPLFMWYHTNVAKHETPSQEGRYYLQFNEVPVGEECGASDNILHTPNASNNDDGGFGIYQLTFFQIPGRPPNAQELWDWKENVNSGTSWLLHHQESAFSYMQDEREQAYQWCLGMEFCYRVPDEQLGSVLFSDYSDTTIEHAVALKRYNGASGGQYAEWDDLLNDWFFHRLNTYNPPFNYVERICETQVP